MRLRGNSVAESVLAPHTFPVPFAAALLAAAAADAAAAAAASRPRRLA